MEKHGPFLSAAVLAASLVVASTAGVAVAATASSSTVSSSVAVRVADASSVESEPIQLAQNGGTEQPELQPRYQPAEPAREGAFNDQYVFGLTRSVAEAPMNVAAKILIFPITVPLDFALLPFEVIGGFFG